MYTPREKLEQALERLTYNGLTGELKWRITVSRHVKPDDDAGMVNDKGYIVLSMRNRKYFGHTVAWALYYKKWPTGRIVLKSDSDPTLSRREKLARRSDIRIENLAEEAPGEKDLPSVAAQRQRKYRSKMLTHERRDLALHRYQISLSRYPGLKWNDVHLHWEVWDDLSRAMLIEGFPTRPRLHISTPDLLEAVAYARELDDMQSILLDDPRPTDAPDWATGTLRPMGMDWLHLSSLVAYDPHTGLFVWRNGPNIGTRADTKYATSDKRRLNLYDFRVPADVAAYFISTGTYVPELIHLDSNPGNNAIRNLAPVPVGHVSKI